MSPNFSKGGRSKHVAQRQYSLLRELSLQIALYVFLIKVACQIFQRSSLFNLNEAMNTEYSLSSEIKVSETHLPWKCVSLVFALVLVNMDTPALEATVTVLYCYCRVGKYFYMPL